MADLEEEIGKTINLVNDQVTLDNSEVFQEKIQIFYSILLILLGQLGQLEQGRSYQSASIPPDMTASTLPVPQYPNKPDSMQDSSQDRQERKQERKKQETRFNRSCRRIFNKDKTHLVLSEQQKLVKGTEQKFLFTRPQHKAPSISYPPVSNNNFISKTFSLPPNMDPTPNPSLIPNDIRPYIPDGKICIKRKKKKHGETQYTYLTPGSESWIEYIRKNIKMVLYLFAIFAMMRQFLTTFYWKNDNIQINASTSHWDERLNDTPSTPHHVSVPFPQLPLLALPTTP
ncbi:hypothetical protein C1646_822518 [Rhizophagus diaphanus]|nr:hypothetical protein C1646_822518 [Rhizophagus diaphanus] [Rhizophagus sp. MUCL 43196]